MTQAPSIGRQVHYVLENGKHRSAEVVTDIGNNIVGLNVALDPQNDVSPGWDYRLLPDPLLEAFGAYSNFTAPALIVFVNSVNYDEGCAPGTWHWPERV